MLSPNLVTEFTTAVIIPAKAIRAFIHAPIAPILSLIAVLIKPAHLLTASPKSEFFIFLNKRDKALNWAVCFSPFPRVEK